MKGIRIIIAVMALLLAMPMVAQDVSLDSKKQEMLKIRAKEKVGQFCKDVAFIASKDKPLKTRNYYVRQAYKLFLNNGLPIYDEDRTLIRDSTFMQVTSLRNKKPRNIALVVYLPRLADLKYPKVEVTSTDIQEMKVSAMRKIGDGAYTCTVYFYQYFIGMTGDNHIVYKDKTNKRVQVFIFEDKTEDGSEFIVRLGDIYADTTEPF